MVKGYAEKVGGEPKKIEGYKTSEEYKTIYIVIDESDVEDKTKIAITFQQNIKYYKAKVVISQPNLNGGQNISVFFSYETTDTAEKTITFTGESTEKYAIKIRKVDENGNPLSGVGFIFRWSDTDSEGKEQKLPDDKDDNGNPVYKGRFLKSNGGTISYVEVDKGENMENATILYTDSKGYITVSGLSLAGNYKAIEWINPHLDYDVYRINEEGENEHIYVDNVEAKDEDEIRNSDATIIVNTPQYITIEGNVWEDVIDINKNEKPDGIYTDNDKYLRYVKVYVMSGDKEVANTVTDKNGHYSFEEINGNKITKSDLSDYLSNYYIKFEYNGLGYQAVDKKISSNYKVSVADEIDRDDLNNKFQTVDGSNVVNQGSLNYTVSGQDYVNSIYYTSKNNKSTFDYTNNGRATCSYGYDGANVPVYVDYSNYGNSDISDFICLVTAKTDSLEKLYKTNYDDAGCISEVNLGLYQREQPDISLEKDLYNVKISVNGKDHIYKYASRFKNAGVYEDGFNVGVEFGDETSEGETSYSRAIYKADYEYANDDKSKELKVYVTYQLLMINQSSSLTAQINSIADYYDSIYTIVSVGTDKDDEKGTVTDDIAYDPPVNSGDNNKIIINNKTKLEAQKATSIYVQFQLSRKQVEEIISLKGENPEGELLKNVAEINSYSIYDSEGNIYAGIDTDSNPGNCVPGDENNYEDDTAKCPGLQLEVAAEREMTGTVFLDNERVSDELMTNQVRQGDGIYNKDTEKGIGGVTVTLTENSGSGNVYETTTDGSGNFEITGYIPGDYTLTYTWGNETYISGDSNNPINVQDYKGTVVNKTSYEAKGIGVNQDPKWYKDEFKKKYQSVEWNDSEGEEIRVSDAIDDYNQRLDIDSETSTMTTMDSTTPTMGISVEYETEISDWNDNHTYSISSIDFGIVERARQEIAIDKRIDSVRLTLANGQDILYAEYEEDEDGKEGELKVKTGAAQIIQHEDKINNKWTNGQVWESLDNELIQGATLEITYKITVNNNSEKDYDSSEYYLYGSAVLPNAEIEKTLIKQKPTGVYDYLDSTMSFDASKQEDTEAMKVMKIDTSTESYNQVKHKLIEGYLDQYEYSEEDDNRVLTNIEGYEYYSDEWIDIMKKYWKDTTTITEQLTKSILNEKTIIEIGKLENEMLPGGCQDVSLKTSKELTSTDEIAIDNEVEIVNVERIGETGRKVTITSSIVYNRGETVTITPPTGDDQNYLPYIILGITSFILLGIGVVFIKKKVLR